VDGKAKLEVTLWTVGNQNITATNADNVSIEADTSPVIQVKGADVHFSLDHPDKVYAYEPFNVTVHARDGDREQNITYTHEVSFKNSDSAGYTPPWYLFTMGIRDANKHGEVIDYVNTTLEYDADGRLVRQTDGQGNAMLYFYDELGRKIRDEYPDGSNETYDYDVGSKLVRKVDRQGNVIDNTYDVIGRLVLTNVTRASGVVGTDHKAFIYDALGRITYALDAVRGDSESNHTITKGYDSLGRVLVEVQDGVSTVSRYDAHGNRELVYPSGYVVEYEFDELGRLKRVSDADGNITQYSYIGPGRTHARVSGNGANTTYEYDGAGRLSGLDSTSNGDQVVGFSYTRYPGSQTFTAIREHLEGRSDALELDSLYRVVGFERGLLDAKARIVETLASDGLQEQSWNLDDAMNWANTTHTINGVSVVQTRSHNALNQVVSIDRNGNVENLTYDLNGNLVENGTLQFKWDYANRLRVVERVSDGATIAVYEYDALNRRVSKNVTNTDANGYTRFYHDGQHEIEEWNATAGADGARLMARYVYGSRTDEVLIMDRFEYHASPLLPPSDLLPSTDDVPVGINPQDLCVLPAISCTSPSRKRYYYHQDAQMNVHAVTNEAGRVVEGYIYESYGSVTVVKPGSSGEVTWSTSDVVEEDGASGIDNPLQYTARRVDVETGLYQYRARYYSTDLGRFISADLIGPWGDTGSLGNAYAYAGGSPYDASDPTGLWTCNQSYYDVCDPCSLMNTGGHQYHNMPYRQASGYCESWPACVGQEEWQPYTGVCDTGGSSEGSGNGPATYGPPPPPMPQKPSRDFDAGFCVLACLHASLGTSGILVGASFCICVDISAHFSLGGPARQTGFYDVVGGGLGAHVDCESRTDNVGYEGSNDNPACGLGVGVGVGVPVSKRAWLMLWS